MINAEDGIKAGDDRALCTGFAAEGLTLPRVRGDTFVDESTRKCRIIPPPEDVRANAVVVDVWIARFGHALHRAENPIKRITEIVQGARGFGVVAVRDRRLRARTCGECRTGASLNIYVDEDEPGLIEPTEEVLEECNVAECDRAALVESAPVPQGVTCIGEDRLAAERRSDLVPRHRKSRGEGARRLRLAPDVGHAEVAEGAHRRLKVLFAAERFASELGERLNDGADLPRWEKCGEVACRLVPLRIRRWNLGRRICDWEEASLRCNAKRVQINVVRHFTLPQFSRRAAADPAHPRASSRR